MRVMILYYNFFDPSGTVRRIGGVETYLWNLSKLISERGAEPFLLQPAKVPFKKQLEHLNIIGVARNKRRLRTNIRKDLYEFALSLINDHKDVIIFGADHASVQADYPRTISIQHGISWDLPGRFLRGSLFVKFPFIPDWINKKYIAYRSLLYFNNCKNRVCVDYNFINWYRTQTVDPPIGRIWIIPNFVDIPDNFLPDMSRHQGKPVKIIFSRRFTEYRGSRIMISSVKQLLNTFQQFECCFAGEGPDDILIKDAFARETRVSIRKYMPDESLEIHNTFQIAVIPSLASEGTSLSLAEAMAAGCAVVASNVGGMTNMIIDGYNGLLIDPTADSLVNSLSGLIRDQDRCLKLGMRAAETAREAFSLKRWKIRWAEVLDAVQSN